MLRLMTPEQVPFKYLVHWKLLGYGQGPDTVAIEIHRQFDNV